MRSVGVHNVPVAVPDRPCVGRIICCQRQPIFFIPLTAFFIAYLRVGVEISCPGPRTWTLEIVTFFARESSTFWLHPSGVPALYKEGMDSENVLDRQK